jgi:type I restriction-modification system DNA methylase subunit
LGAKSSTLDTLQNTAALAIGSIIWQDEHGQDVKLRSISWLIDNAFDEIEKANPKLKGILNRIGQYQLDNDKLLDLINTFLTPVLPSLNIMVKNSVCTVKIFSGMSTNTF